MSSGTVTFPCRDIALEGEIKIPQGDPPFPGVIVCHPHPLYGGDMLNNVITAIWQTLAKQSMAALRFNFRGVGSSQGRYDGGNGECEDVRAALDYLVSRPEIDASLVGLSGYSFGAGIALSVAASDKRVKQLALVSPPLPDASRKQLKDYRRPKIVLIGDADHVIHPEQLRQLASDSSEPGQYQVIAGVDHFWQGSEMEAAARIAGFFSQGFNRS